MEQFFTDFTEVCFIVVRESATHEQRHGEQ